MFEFVTLSYSIHYDSLVTLMSLNITSEYTLQIWLSTKHPINIAHFRDGESQLQTGVVHQPVSVIHFRHWPELNKHTNITTIILYLPAMWRHRYFRGSVYVNIPVLMTNFFLGSLEDMFTWTWWLNGGRGPFRYVTPAKTLDRKSLSLYWSYPPNARPLMVDAKLWMKSES